MAVTRRFTVDVPNRYELIVAFHKGTEIDIRTGPQPDAFGAEFVIRSGGEPWQRGRTSLTSVVRLCIGETTRRVI